MQINFKPSIHPYSPPSSVINKKQTVQITEENPIYNTNSTFQSGLPFFFDTEIFRGKGCMYSRLHSNFPSNNSKYNQKNLIIRIVGQFKCPFDLTEIFVGGFFENGVRGLPPAFVLNWGLKLARQMTRHFFISLFGQKPYVAVPLIPLVDELVILSFEGQSENLWKSWDLSEPLTENWICSLHDKTLIKTILSKLQTIETAAEEKQKLNFFPNLSSQQQRNIRRSLRSEHCDKWFKFPIQPHHLFAIEITDSAFLFEKLIIQYKVMNLFNFNIYLKNYIKDLPFTLFLTDRQNDKKEKNCKGCLRMKNFSTSYQGFPDGWTEKGFCTFCFPTKDKNKILLSLLVTNL